MENCDFLGTHTITDDDRKQLNAKYPNYCFNHVSKFQSTSDATRNMLWQKKDVKLFLSTEKKIRYKDKDIKKDFLEFNISNDKYKDWLNTGKGIFFFEKEKDTPKNLKKCEELFDKNVLEIKKRVNEIGEINDVIANEQLNLALYDDSKLIEETFVQRVNKRLQLYGFISVPFTNKKGNNLINLNNLRKKNFLR